MSAVLDPVFQSLIQSLLTAATNDDAALRSTQQATWDSLGIPDPSAGAYTDRTAIAAGLVRDGSSQIYHDAVNNNGTTNLTKGAKICSDLMAGIQRDILTQRSSRIRTVALEAARRYRQAQPTGPISNNWLRQPQSLLQQNPSYPPNPAAPETA